MGKPWENHRKTMGKGWFIWWVDDFNGLDWLGKSWETMISPIELLGVSCRISLRINPLKLVFKWSKCKIFQFHIFCPEGNYYTIDWEVIRIPWPLIRVPFVIGFYTECVCVCLCFPAAIDSQWLMVVSTNKVQVWVIWKSAFFKVFNPNSDTCSYSILLNHIRKPLLHKNCFWCLKPSELGCPPVFNDNLDTPSRTNHGNDRYHGPWASQWATHFKIGGFWTPDAPWCWNIYVHLPQESPKCR